MWQRIQTVFLALVILSLIGAFLTPIWIYHDPSGKSYALYALHYSIYSPDATVSATNLTTNVIVKYFPYCLTAVLLAASATIAFMELIRYNDRITQIKLGALNSLFLAGSLGAAVYFGNDFITTFHGGAYGLGLWLPAVAVVCNWAAIRFIKRDEKLVRDSDRLR